MNSCHSISTLRQDIINISYLSSFSKERIPSCHRVLIEEVNPNAAPERPGKPSGFRTDELGIVHLFMYTLTISIYASILI